MVSLIEGNVSALIFCNSKHTKCLSLISEAQEEFSINFQIIFLSGDAD